MTKAVQAGLSASVVCCSPHCSCNLHLCLQDFYLEDVLKFIGYKAPDSHHHQDKAEADSNGDSTNGPLARLQRSATEQAIMDAFLKGDEGSWERLLEVTGAQEGSGNPACINVAHQATGYILALLCCDVPCCLCACLSLPVPVLSACVSVRKNYHNPGQGRSLMRVPQCSVVALHQDPDPDSDGDGRGVTSASQTRQHE